MVFWGCAQVLFSEEKRKDFFWLLLVGFVSVLIIAINFVPLLLHLPLTTRAGGLSFEQATELSMSFVDFFRLIWPEDSISPIQDIAQREHYLPSLFIGVVGFLLFFRGVLNSKDRSFLWVILFFGILALGINTFIYSLVIHIPLLKTIQYPEKYWMGIIPVIAFFGAQGLRGASNRIFSVVIFLCVAELVGGARLNFPIENPEEVFTEPELAQRIHERTPPSKVFPLLWDDTLHKVKIPLMRSQQPLHETIHDTLYPNVGSRHGIGYVLGADRLRILRHGMCISAAINSEPMLRHRMLRKMGTSFYLTWRAEDTQELLQHTPLKLLEGGLFIEPNPEPFLYWTGTVLRARTTEPILALMASPTSAVMVLEEDPGVSTIPDINGYAPPKGFSCQIEAEQPLYRCTWQAKEEGVIVLRQNWLPGWYAELDDVSHPIARVNMYMIGVHAPKGKHTLVFKYTPNGFWFGLVLSILGLLLCGGVGWKLFRDTKALAEDLQPDIEHR
jgi:hypothetical protein